MARKAFFAAFIIDEDIYTPEPGPVDHHFVATDLAQSSFGEQRGGNCHDRPPVRVGHGDGRTRRFHAAESDLDVSNHALDLGARFGQTRLHVERV